MVKRISTILLPVIMFFAAFSGTFAAGDVDPRVLREVGDFSKIASTLEKKRVPLVLMFSADHCPYCVQVENDFLIPMQISGDYEERAVIRKLEIGYGSRVVDFDGKRIDADEIAERYDVSVTPTLVFLDGHGRQLAPSQVGVTTPDYYGGYIDESIATAIDILRRNKPLRVKLTSAAEPLLADD